jgi:hypothetical protein
MAKSKEDKARILACERRLLELRIEENGLWVEVAKIRQEAEKK